MAMQYITVSLAAQATKTFTFPTPAGSYGKLAGITISGGFTSLVTFDVDSPAAGTTTGTVNLPAAITGTVEVVVFDKPDA